MKEENIKKMMYIGNIIIYFLSIFIIAYLLSEGIKKNNDKNSNNIKQESSSYEYVYHTYIWMDTFQVLNKVLDNGYLSIYRYDLELTSPDPDNRENIILFLPIDQEEFEKGDKIILNYKKVKE